MGETFGMDVEEIERQVVRLIQTGGIQARVDSRNKVCAFDASFTAIRD